MRKRKNVVLGFLVAMLLMLGLAAMPAAADSVLVNTGNPDGFMAMASRPAGIAAVEIEAADDFILSSAVSVSGGSFTGLLPSGASLSDINQVIVEIYRAFPNDSTNPPSGNVPTRLNSPSDVALASRDSASSGLTFTPTILSSTFTAGNSVLNGINPSPNQLTEGEGSVTGEEVVFDVAFTTPFNLPADHYFFVLQVLLGNGNFYWLSAPKPIVAPGTPFIPDLQTWMRNDDLSPDWLRVGTDIVGRGTFNGTFTLLGSAQAVPEPPTLMLLLGVGFATSVWRWRTRQRGSNPPVS